MTGAPGGTWKGVACSADGGRIYAAGTPGIWSYTVLPSAPTRRKIAVPVLGIHLDGPSVQLFWLDAPGLVLERKSMLGDSNWTPLTNPAPVLVNGTNTVTLPPVAPFEYFRLRR